MSDVEIHAEAVERLARELRRSIGQHEDVRRDAAATLRALRAALDAAEKRAGYLYDGLRATVEAGGGIAQPGVSDEFLVTCTPMEMRAVRRSRDAALAARDAAWRAGRDAAADYVDECLAELGLHLGTASVRALQPPADLAAEAPGDAVAQEREACAVIAETMPKPHVESRVSPTGPAWKTPQPDDWPDAIAAAIRARAGA